MSKKHTTAVLSCRSSCRLGRTCLFGAGAHQLARTRRTGCHAAETRNKGVSATRVGGLPQNAGLDVCLIKMNLSNPGKRVAVTPAALRRTAREAKAAASRGLHARCLLKHDPLCCWRESFSGIVGIFALSVDSVYTANETYTRSRCTPPGEHETQK